MSRVARRGPNSCTCVSRPVASLMLHRGSNRQRNGYTPSNTDRNGYTPIGASSLPPRDSRLACLSMDDRLCVSIGFAILSSTTQYTVS